MRYLDELCELNLPSDQYAVFGSGVLAIRGLRENRDIDIVVKQELWKKLINKYPVNDVGAIEIGNVEIWDSYGLEPKCDVESFIDSSENIDGIFYVRLEHVIEWKKLKGREKDLVDVGLMEDYLKQNNN